MGELVVHRKTGYLINELDLKAAERALRDLVSSKDKRLSMGELGRQRAFNLFSVNEMRKKYIELYLS